MAQLDQTWWSVCTNQMILFFDPHSMFRKYYKLPVVLLNIGMHRWRKLCVHTSDAAVCIYVYVAIDVTLHTVIMKIIPWRMGTNRDEMNANTFRNQTLYAKYQQKKKLDQNTFILLRLALILLSENIRI